ncbi:phosphopantetheine-binding protein [Actinoplanes sp. NPDC051346]|uniref:phosphopantetheine-binding protein n=1 Tax=Actinoplanes sp. NPDC051346 TaxID=3155048 RepID=UPI003415003F
MVNPSPAHDGVADLSCRGLERVIRSVWSRTFARDVAPGDDFFELGGDSLSIIDTVAEMRRLGVALRASDALRHPTPARLAEHLTVGSARTVTGRKILPPRELRTSAGSDPGAPVTVTALAPGPGQPLVVFPSSSHLAAELAAVRACSGPWPVLAVGAAGSDRLLSDAGDVAAAAVRSTQAVVADAPARAYRLLGFGSGAVLAVETARRLRATGREAELLALVQPPVAGAVAGTPVETAVLHEQRLTNLARRFALTGDESLTEVGSRMRAAGWYEEARAEDLAGLQLAWARAAQTIRRYEPAPLPGAGCVLIHDAAAREAVDQWRAVLGSSRVHLLDHGLADPGAALGDAGVGRLLRQEIAR